MRLRTETSSAKKFKMGRLMHPSVCVCVKVSEVEGSGQGRRYEFEGGGGSMHWKVGGQYSKNTTI